MLTELESLELYTNRLKINKIWFIRITHFRLDSKKPKTALCGVNYGMSKSTELLPKILSYLAVKEKVN